MTDWKRLDDENPRLRGNREKADDTPIIQPEDWQPLGERVMTIVIVFGSATLRAGIPATTKFPPVVGKDRQELMCTITDGIKANRHLKQEEAQNLLLGAAALALSGTGADAIRRAGLAGMTLTYTITPKSAAGDYNWRLVVEQSKNVVH
jgi:hypothetical protein